MAHEGVEAATFERLWLLRANKSNELPLSVAKCLGREGLEAGEQMAEYLQDRNTSFCRSSLSKYSDDLSQW